MRLTKVAGAAAAVLILAAAVPAGAREITENVDETFAVKKGWTLRLRHGDGDVTLIPWEKDSVEVNVYYHAEIKGWGDDSDRDFKVEFREKNGVLEITGKETGEGFMGFHVFILKEYSYTIHAPSYLELDFQGDDGNVELEKWKGPVEITLDDGELSMYNCEPGRTKIRAADGDIVIDGISGTFDLIGDDLRLDINRGSFEDCRIQMADGDIWIRDSEGDFDIEVEDGDTELRRIGTNLMDLKSEDGDFDIELLKTDVLDLEIRTEDGDVDLGLQRGISASFTIDVDDGRIRTDLPSAVKIQEGDAWLSGKLGSGSGKIRIRTYDGSVMIREIR